MKQIHKDEIYNQLSEFLKGKGIELKAGSYAKGIHAGCSMLADAINLSQAGLERAKTGIERGVDQMRQAIHEKTRPRPPYQRTTASSKANKARPSRKAGSRSSKRPGGSRK